MEIKITFYYPLSKGDVEVGAVTSKVGYESQMPAKRMVSRQSISKPGGIIRTIFLALHLNVLYN